MAQDGCPSSQFLEDNILSTSSWLRATFWHFWTPCVWGLSIYQLHGTLSGFVICKILQKPAFTREEICPLSLKTMCNVENVVFVFFVFGAMSFESTSADLTETKTLADCMCKYLYSLTGWKWNRQKTKKQKKKCSKAHHDTDEQKVYKYLVL